MKKSITLSLIGIAAFALLSGCSFYGNTSSNSSGTPSTSTQQTSVASNSINIQNFSFNPATLTVKKGTSVTWTNNDAALHQIKSVTFNSDPLSQGQSYSFTFNDAGTFNYSCAIHPSMTGTIIVE